MPEPLLITLLLILVGLVLAGKFRSDGRRIRALTPQEGKILRRNTASSPYLVVMFFWIICAFYYYPLISSGDPPPPYLSIANLILPGAVLLLLLVQPQGPVRWSAEGMSGPRAILLRPFPRTLIGWQEISRISCRYRWGKPSGWMVEAADGRRISFNVLYDGPESALAALRHYRPDLDPDVLTP